MKKLIAVFLAAVCTVCLLAGCGGSSDVLDSKNPVTITLWHYYDGDLRTSLNAQVEEFNQSVGIKSGVLVEAVSLGAITDLEAALEESAKGVINSAEMPELFFSYADTALELMQDTELVDLYEYFDEEELGSYVESFLEDGVLDGKQIVLPVVKSTELFYLNQTDFAAFANATGHTTEELATWDSLFDVAAAYYEWSDGEPLFGFDNTANFLIIASKQLELDLLAGDGTGAGEVRLDETVLRRVFDAYFNGFALGYYDAVGNFRSDDVKTGELVGYVGSSSGASFFPSEVVKGNDIYEIDFAALGYPTFADGERYTVQQGAGICMTATDEARQYGSALFLQWLTGTEPNVEFSLQTGYLPVRLASYQSDALKEGLAALRAGNAADNITADVYEVASDSVLNGKAYAITPFDGSYSARYAIVDPLEELALAAREDTMDMRAEGESDEAILAALGDKYFADWMNAITAALDERGLAYTNN